MTATGSDVLAVDTQVVDQGGRFVVVLVVVFADGAVRHEVRTYAKRGKAELAASVIRKAVDRDGPGPFAGGGA